MSKQTAWDTFVLQANLAKLDLEKFLEKMTHWEREVPKMSTMVREIWARERNSLDAKAKHFLSVYEKMILYPDLNLSESAGRSQVTTLRRELDAMHQAYYRATSYLRSADRDAHRKEQEAAQQKEKSDRYAGMSLGGSTPGTPPKKKDLGPGRSGGISL